MVQGTFSNYLFCTFVGYTTCHRQVYRNLKMKIALIGYGKMGHEIERIALERGHEIVCTIDIGEEDKFTSSAFGSADVAIEFTSPQSALQNYRRAFAAGVAVVAPGAAHVVRALQDQEVVDALGLEADAGAQAAEAAADDGDSRAHGGWALQDRVETKNITLSTVQRRPSSPPATNTHALAGKLARARMVTASAA